MIQISEQMMFSCGDNEARKLATGILPQLLNTIDAGQLNALLNDRLHVLQEKHDGRRLLLWKQSSGIAGVNKLGLSTKFPERVGRQLQLAGMDFLIDGELVGDQYHAFDLLELEGRNLRGCSYETRYFQLAKLLGDFAHPHVHLVESVSTPWQKKSFFERLKTANREGVVFKRRDAVYSAGRPYHDGPQLKFKFCETASFIVGGINQKRSVSLLVLDGEICIPVGNVTIPPNHDIPPIGAIVECRYLYAYRSGCIFQPVYLGIRDDIRAEECTTAQLKYKSERANQALCQSLNTSKTKVK